MSNKIEMYMHCMLCSRELPEDVAPRDWARLNVGATSNGLQVWCTRHDVSVAALDFRGQKIVYEDEDEFDECRKAQEDAKLATGRRRCRIH